MSPDKTYTRKISISILKYSTLYTRPTLHCSIHSVNPPTYRDGLSAEGWRALLSLVMHGLCSNKYLYSASLSLTVFIGPTALAWPVLRSVHPSLCLGVFLELDHQFVLNFGKALETQMTLYVIEPNFFRKTSFTSETEKMGQNWAKNRVLGIYQKFSL